MVGTGKGVDEPGFSSEFSDGGEDVALPDDLSHRTVRITIAVPAQQGGDIGAGEKAGLAGGAHRHTRRSHTGVDGFDWDVSGQEAACVIEREVCGFCAVKRICGVAFSDTHSVEEDENHFVHATII